MDILSSEYCKSILLRHNSDVTVYNYDTREYKDKCGILHIIWDGELSSKIWLYKDSIRFIIKDDYYTHCNKEISNRFISSQTFEYFSDMIKSISSDRLKNIKMCSLFGDKLPIDYIREEKLSKLL